MPSGKQIAALVATGFLSLFGLFAIGYALTPIPDVNALAETSSTILYYSDGKTELGRIENEHREPVDLQEVPPHVQQSVLAAENRTFYTDKGVSPRGIARALWTNLRGDSVQGGSTITQQHAKNIHLTQERSLQRKFKEFFVAIKLDRQLSKDQILEDYLNIAYFGRGAYGIQAASKAYFDKPVSELTVDEGAMLASVIRSPGLYSPEDNADRLSARMEYVYNGMEKEGWLDPAKRPKAGLPKSLKERKVENSKGGPKGFLIREVERELARKGFEEQEVKGGGLRVRTTFDKKAQDAAVKAVNNQRKSGELDKSLQVGLSAIEPGTGRVVAMYGGSDYVKNQFNNATDANIPAGSTFKPFALTAALEDGVGLKSRYDGNSPREFDVGGDEPYKVENFGPGTGNDYGTVDLLEATAKSINTVYVDLGLSLGEGTTEGPQKVVDAAVKAGIPEKTGDLKARASVVLGPATPKIVDVANSYATFAAQGEYAEHYVVEEVQGSNGGVLYKAEPKKEQVFEKDVMADLTYALRGVVDRPGGSGARAKELGRPSAGKTGTAQDNKAVWYNGYVPQLAASVSIFQPNEQGSLVSLKDSSLTSATGGRVPAAIWTDFMKMYLEDKPVEQFPEPAWVGKTINPKPTQTPKPTPTEKPKGKPTPEVTVTKPGNGNKVTSEPVPSPSITTSEPLVTVEPTLPGGGGGGGGGGG